MKEGEVADKNRGRSVDDDGEDRPDDIDDVNDDDANDELEELDEDDDDVNDEVDDTADEDAKPERSRKKKVPAAAGAVSRSKTKDTGRRSGGIFGRLARFVREIVAELQKVIWPTRKELLTYTTVVVVFVAIMMTFVALLDLGFVRVMFLVFGRGTTDDAVTN